MNEGSGSEADRLWLSRKRRGQGGRAKAEWMKEISQ